MKASCGMSTLAELPHALFAFLLFVQQIALARGVAADKEHETGVL
jgi:hypothetical protein